MATDLFPWKTKPPITDEELIILCLNNAPCGTDKKQVQRLINLNKIILERPTGLYNIFPLDMRQDNGT